MPLPTNQGNTDVRFSDKALAQLRAKGEKRLLATEEARTLAGMSLQQWQRLTRTRGFPNREHIGRVWGVNAHELADFLAKRNATHEGMTLTQAAAYCRTTVYTLRDLGDAGKFIEPLGLVNGHPRFSRAEVEAWQAQRLGGLEPPAMKARKARKQGARDGQAKGNGRTRAQE